MPGAKFIREFQKLSEGEKKQLQEIVLKIMKKRLFRIIEENLDTDQLVKFQKLTTDLDLTIQDIESFIRVEIPHIEIIFNGVINSIISDIEAKLN